MNRNSCFRTLSESAGYQTGCAITRPRKTKNGAATSIYCHLTTTTHNSLYLWRRKVATLATGHIGFLAAAARKFGVGEEVLRQLNLLCDKCP